MSLQGFWLTRGYFDLRNPDGGQTVTQQVRDQLADRLGKPRRAVKIRNYPVGPAWRHTVWWGEGEVGFPEAQFMMRISEEYPILSVGISVEKGLSILRVGAPHSELMDETWSWKRFMDLAESILAVEIPNRCAEIGRPISVRFFPYDFRVTPPISISRRTFVFDGEAWFERHVGSAKSNQIADYIRELYAKDDWWVDTYIACDLGTSEVDGMSVDMLTALLWQFAPLRSALRYSGQPPAGT